MISNKKNLLKTISAILLLGMVFSCKNSIDEIDALTDPMSLPIQTTENVEYVFSEYGKILNKLIATKVERYTGENNERIEVSEGFEFYTYDTLEQVSSILTADFGTYFQEEEIFIARKNVVLENINGERLNTEELTWLQREDRVYTNKLVQITTEDGVLWGDSLESNSTFDNYKLFFPRGELEINEEKEDESS